MECPYCGGDAYVIDTREMELWIRRRRQCPDCRKRFTTYELPEELIEAHIQAITQEKLRIVGARRSLRSCQLTAEGVGL